MSNRPTCKVEGQGDAKRKMGSARFTAQQRVGATSSDNRSTSALHVSNCTGTVGRRVSQRFTSRLTVVRAPRSRAPSSKPWLYCKSAKASCSTRTAVLNPPTPKGLTRPDNRANSAFAKGRQWDSNPHLFCNKEMITVHNRPGPPEKETGQVGVNGNGYMLPLHHGDHIVVLPGKLLR